MPRASTRAVTVMLSREATALWNPTVPSALSNTPLTPSTDSTLSSTRLLLLPPSLRSPLP
ncbi:hypothetical protein C0J52_28366 [Blattella germanica]|nr:hypothetical protein C0J52_28366 [Blattella germanica]